MKSCDDAGENPKLTYHVSESILYCTSFDPTTEFLKIISLHLPPKAGLKQMLSIIAFNKVISTMVIRPLDDGPGHDLKLPTSDLSTFFWC